MPQFSPTPRSGGINDPRGDLAQQIAARRLKRMQTGAQSRSETSPVTPPVTQETGIFPASDTGTQELLQKIAGFRTTLGL